MRLKNGFEARAVTVPGVSLAGSGWPRLVQLAYGVPSRWSSDHDYTVIIGDAISATTTRRARLSQGNVLPKVQFGKSCLTSHKAERAILLPKNEDFSLAMSHLSGKMLHFCVIP